MKAQDIVTSLQNRKGQHVQITWQRMAKTLKSFGGMIAKRTTAYVRSGINYSNLSDIRDAIEAGTREAVEGLPWGQWREGAANFIIDHKDKEYVRLYPATFANLQTPRVTWLLDGNEVEYAAVEPYLLSSEKRKDDERPACFTVNADDVLTIAD